MALKRVNLANLEEELKDCTLDDLRNDLANKIIQVYLIVGNDGDAVWDVGAASCAMRKPEYNLYLAESINDVRTLIKNGNPRAILFRKDPNAQHRLLTEVEATSLNTVEGLLAN